jgi:hypothetical protein
MKHKFTLGAFLFGVWLCWIGFCLYNIGHTVGRIDQMFTDARQCGHASQQ